MIGLSILIPSTPDRRPFIEKLIVQFDNQLWQIGSKNIRMHGGDFETMYYEYSFEGRSVGSEVEIIIFEDEIKQSIGFKRNMLMREANGAYLDFVDSDDRIGPNYFKRVFEGIEKDVDCCSLKGIITEDGNNPLIFEHSIRYKEYKANPEGMPVRYERFPNHLNCIRSSIAKQFQFPEKNHGEDTDWATQIFKSGLIKTEHYIDEVIYYYDWVNKK